MRSCGPAGWSAHGYYGFRAQTFGNPDGASAGGGAWQGVTNQGGDGAAPGLTPMGIRDGGANINGPNQGGGGTPVPPGTVWTSRVSNDTFDLISLAYGDGTFVALDDDIPGNVVRSTDGGATWSAPIVAGPPAVGVSCLCFGNTNFMLGAGNALIMRSVDNGLTWQNPTSTGTGITGMAVTALAYSPTLNIFLLMGNGAGPDNYSVTANGGGLWAAPGLFTNAFWQENGLIWDGGQFVALGAQSGTNDNTINTSADGQHWVETVIPTTVTLNRPVAFGGGHYMIGSGSAATVRIASTPAGLATAADLPVTFGPTADTGIYSQGYDPVSGAFIAFGNNGGVSTSTDLGVTWTPGTLNYQPPGSFNSAQSTASDGVHQVAVGDAGNISTLP